MLAVHAIALGVPLLTLYCCHWAGITWGAQAVNCMPCQRQFQTHLWLAVIVVGSDLPLHDMLFSIPPTDL